MVKLLVVVKSQANVTKQFGKLRNDRYFNSARTKEGFPKTFVNSDKGSLSVSCSSFSYLCFMVYICSRFKNSTKHVHQKSLLFLPSHTKTIDNFLTKVHQLYEQDTRDISRIDDYVRRWVIWVTSISK